MELNDKKTVSPPPVTETAVKKKLSYKEQREFDMLGKELEELENECRKPDFALPAPQIAGDYAERRFPLQGERSRISDTSPQVDREAPATYLLPNNIPDI